MSLEAQRSMSITEQSQIHSDFALAAQTKDTVRLLLEPHSHKMEAFSKIFTQNPLIYGTFLVVVVKNSLADAGDTGDMGSMPGSGRSPGGGNGNPLQYSCHGQRSLVGHSPWGHRVGHD